MDPSFFERLWKKEFERVGAIWIHDGNPERPYARLTSGKISNGFFNATKVIEHPTMVAAAVNNLIGLVGIGADFFPDTVIGSAFGAITLAHELARQLKKPTFHFTQPTEDKEMRLQRFELKKGSKVLIIDDVMTTGGTTSKTIKEIQRHSGDVLTKVLFLVNRSGETLLDGREIIALINHPMPTWDEGSNPFTPNGKELVPPVRPKENWDALTKPY